jgi:hypothetical protein
MATSNTSAKQVVELTPQLITFFVQAFISSAAASKEYVKLGTTQRTLCIEAIHYYFKNIEKVPYSTSTDELDDEWWELVFEFEVPGTKRKLLFKKKFSPIAIKQAA